MMRFNSEAERITWERWNEAVLERAEHSIDCSDGCSILGATCPIGADHAAREQALWGEYHQVRRAETAQLAGVVDRMEGAGM